MARLAGKRAVMEMLRAEGVEYIFGNPGTSEGPLIDALEDFPEITYVLAVQEGAAMGMADGYARSTGKPSFVNLHIQTGLANGLSLLHNASESGTPMVLTSCNNDVRKLAEGRTDLVEMTRQFTKWSAEVTHPEQVPAVLRRAFNEAKTPPTGPVYVAFSANALDDEAEVEIVPSSQGYFRTAPDAVAIDKASRMLEEAERPVMLVGERLAHSRGTAEAVRVAEMVGARVYAPFYSEMNFPSGHPQFLGPASGLLPAGRALLSSSDVVLCVGANVSSGYFYTSGRALERDTGLIHVDSDPREVGRSEPTDLGIIADPKTALAHLADSLESNMTGSAREAAKGRAAAAAEEKQAQKQAWAKRLRERWSLSPMSTERMMTEVAGVLPGDAIIADDSVTTRASVQGAIELNEPGCVFGERGGSLGWGMGGALGLKLANPDRPVVAIVGDGSAMMTVQALWTAVNEGIPVVYVICNNRSYRILKLNMGTYKRHILNDEAPESRYIGMDFPAPFDFEGIAASFGVDSRRIEDPADLAPAMKRALDLGEPALLDVVIDGSV